MHRLSALRERYQQYRAMALEGHAVIAILPERVVSWGSLCDVKSDPEYFAIKASTFRRGARARTLRSPRGPFPPGDIKQSGNRCAENGYRM